MKAFTKPVAAMAAVFAAAILAMSPAPAAEPATGLIITDESRRIPTERPADAEAMRLLLRVGDDAVLGPNTAVMTRPSQVMRLELDASAASAASRLVPPLLNAPEGRGFGGMQVRTENVVAWEWTAGMGLDVGNTSLLWRSPPQGGHYHIHTRMLQTQTLDTGADGGHPVRLQRRWGAASFSVLVGEEFEPRSLTLQGVAMGLYPDQTAENVPASVAQNREGFRPPRWFYRVTPETSNLQVSKHFVLGDFAMDRARFGDRQFIALEPRLLVRLDMIADEVQKNINGARVRVLRGFLSPIAAEVLRREGANISEFSRFLYGDAAVIIVDSNGDNLMDDVTGDGQVGSADAEWLAQIAEGVERQLGQAGGLGTYGRSNDPTLPTTPFIQVDARGRYARWQVGANPPTGAAAASPAESTP